MSIEIMNRVLECGAFAESSHKFVLLILANCANAEGFCYPSRGYIARVTGLHSDTVARALERLKSDGHITENRREGKNSTFLVHPITTEPTPRTMRGVNKPALQESPAAQIASAAGAALRPDRQSPPGGDRAASASTNATEVQSSTPSDPPHHAGGEASKLSTNPPHDTGGSCGQTIHSPPHHAGTPPAPCGDTPRTMREETSDKHQRNSETPDGKKNPQEPEAGHRRFPSEPTEADRQRAKAQELQRIEQALQRKAGGQ